MQPEHDETLPQDLQELNEHRLPNNTISPVGLSLTPGLPVDDGGEKIYRGFTARQLDAIISNRTDVQVLAGLDGESNSFYGVRVDKDKGVLIVLSDEAKQQMRVIVREELERIIAEQEQWLNEIFKQSEKHDGKLDEDEDNWSHATVELRPKDLGMGDIQISGGYGDIECSSIYLDAKQALSLRDWLIQESSTLERLAKEQASE